MRTALNKLLPPNKPRNVLEEAEWEDDAGDNGGFERELQVQGEYINAALGVSKQVATCSHIHLAIAL